MTKTIQKSIVGAGLKLLGVYWVMVNSVALIWSITGIPIVHYILIQQWNRDSDHGSYPGTPLAHDWMNVMWYFLWILCGTAAIILSDIIASWLCNMSKMRMKTQNNASHTISNPFVHGEQNASQQPPSN